MDIDVNVFRMPPFPAAPAGLVEPILRALPVAAERPDVQSTALDVLKIDIDVFSLPSDSVSSCSSGARGGHFESPTCGRRTV